MCLSEPSAFVPAASEDALVAKRNAALTRRDPNGHESRGAGISGVFIPGGDLEKVAIAGLALCNPGFDIHCGLTVVPDGRAPETVAATDDLPVRVDWLQHQLREGPGLDGHPGEILAIKDLAADERWPDFGKMCVAVLNIRSMVSIRIPLPTRDRASLNFYSSEATAFEHLEVEPVLRLARRSAPGIKELISEFRGSILGAAEGNYSRVAIAVGTLMARHRVDSSDAFDLLRAASQALDRALLDVAIETAMNGRLPQTAINEARLQHWADSGPNTQQHHAATPTRLRPRLDDPAASGVQQRAVETVHAVPPSVGGPGMWHNHSRR